MTFYKGETGSLSVAVDPDSGGRAKLAGTEEGNLFVPLKNTNNNNKTEEFLSNNDIFEPGGSSKITDADDFQIGHVYLVKEADIASDDAEGLKIDVIRTSLTNDSAKRAPNVRNWTFSLNREAYETTSIGQNFRNYTHGMLTGDGTIDILNSDDDDYKNLIKNLTSSNADGDVLAGDVLLVLSISKGDEDSQAPGYTGDSYFAFRAFLTVGDFSATVGELSAVNFNFNTNGPVALSFP